MAREWLWPFFEYLPVYGLFFLGVGIPWALILLPRDEWRNRPTVLALGLALGPLFGTTWLFILGTWGEFFVERALAGIILLSIIGITGAWLRRHTGYREPHTRPEPWTSVERLLLGALGLAFVAHVWLTLFWPFVQYDTLWTFGYNPRLFLHYNHIPDWVGYYPQLVPLTFTYGQLITGEMNDYVAKAAVPWFFAASLMMAYILGARVWGKRSIGILTTALWALVPGALFWSGSGDLEHPVTVYFTGAVVFFILGWRSHNPRHAVISGLMFAGALWTKPTAGSFALGVILIIMLLAGRMLLPDRLRAMLHIPARPEGKTTLFRQKFTLAIITGLASIPIGAMWYLRNYAKGLNVLVFPDPHWLTLAQRSGQELGWGMLIFAAAAALLTAQLWGAARSGVREAQRRLGAAWLGLALFLVATLPTALVFNKPWKSNSAWEWAFGVRLPTEKLGPLEVGLIAIGLALGIYGLWPAWTRTTERARSSAVLCSLLIAPFAAVWFWNYSYHYRLMLTITPVLASLVAALLDAWLLPWMAQNRLRQRAANTLTVALCLPALVIAPYLTFRATFIDRLLTTREKYAEANPALMEVVEKIEEVNATRTWRENQLYIVGNGEERLNFFFPWMHSLWSMWSPTRLDELHSATDLILGGTRANFVWEQNDQFPNEVSAQMDIAFAYRNPYLEVQGGNLIRTFFEPILATDDGRNLFVMFNLYPPHRQYTLDDINPPFRFEDAEWPFITLHGFEFRRVVPDDSEQIPLDGAVQVLHGGEALYLQLYWQRTSSEPIPKDYHVLIHLIDPQTGEILAQRDGQMIDGLLPLTVMPYPDIVPDRRLWTLPDDLRAGPVSLLIGFYDPVEPNYPRIPMQDGAEIYRIDGRLMIETP